MAKTCVLIVVEEKLKVSSSMAREIDSLRASLKEKEGNYCHNKISVDSDSIGEVGLLGKKVTMQHLQVLENEKEKKLLQSEIQGYHHQLEETKKMQDQIQDGGKTLKHYGGEALSFIGSEWHPYKMLLIGETGSGKTSFLNLLCNSKLFEELGTNIDATKLDQIRHYNDLKIEDSTACAMESKTSDAKFYKTEVCRMRMTVIDTPGFGDSRGLEQDKKNVKKIIDALKGEDYINCVCLIINGRQSRMTASLKYILSEISTIMPREIFNNIIVVFTNTADPLDCNFDISELDHYFGKKSDCAFYIENPYCRIEKAKQKSKQLSVDQIARSLRKSFEDTAESLLLLEETIKDFNDVHTLHFTQFYYKKEEIEKDVIMILASYDEQTELEKLIKIKEEEVYAALVSKNLNSSFSTTRNVVMTRPVSTQPNYNTLCGAPGCYSNCHMPCSCLTKSYDKEEFKKCRVFGGRVTCQVCGHSYRDHYHDEVMFQKVIERQEFVDEAMKKKFEEATDMEQRANYLRQGLHTRREELLRKKNSLLKELKEKMTKFQRLGISNQNYAKVLEKQLDVVKLRIEDSVGNEREQLNAFKVELEKKLKIATSALEQLPK